MKAIELQKLRDKLEEARDISVISDSCRDCYMIDTKNELINQALAFLQAEPEFPSHLEWPHQVHLRAKTAEELQEKIDCLFPPIQAEPGEILKEARVLLKAGANEEQWAFATKLREACKRFDNQQAEIAILKQRTADSSKIIAGLVIKCGNARELAMLIVKGSYCGNNDCPANIRNLAQAVIDEKELGKCKGHTEQALTKGGG